MTPFEFIIILVIITLGEIVKAVGAPLVDFIEELRAPDRHRAIGGGPTLDRDEENA